MEPIRMSSAHRRAISAALIQLDRGICELEDWASGALHCSVLYREHSSLTARQCDQILREVQGIRSVLLELKSVLKLATNITDASRLIPSRCAVMWEALQEIEGRRLRRFGPTSTRLVDYLDPKISKILKQLQQISALVSAD